MKVPVFVSCPTSLSVEQEAARSRIVAFLGSLNLEPRALGRSDYPTEFPLREVYVIAKHCSGGVILGFEQLRVTTGVNKPGTAGEKAITARGAVSVPSPWNHLEAGILFGLGIPLLIFRQSGVSGGVFDNGVTDVFVQTIHPGAPTEADDQALKEVFLKWHANVREHYYGR